MKPTEYPEEDSRTTSSTTAVAPTDAPAEPKAAVERPRFVEIPPTPEQIRAQRNVAWGVVCLTLAAIGLWLGIKFDRTTAGVSLASSLGSFGIFWLLYNSQILRQRHGFFLAFGLTAVLAAALPFVAVGLGKLDRIADESIAGKSSDTAGRIAPPPVPTAANAPAAPTAPELSPDDAAPAGSSDTENVAATSVKSPRTAEALGSESKNVAHAAQPTAKSASTKKAQPADDGKVHDLTPPVIDPGAGKLMRIEKDCIVSIKGKDWRLRAGQIYPITEVNFDEGDDGMIGFLVDDVEVKIAMGNAKLVGKSLEKPDDINKMAIMEAANRYPQLGVADSKENELFLARIQEMKSDPALADYFKNPKWPIVLADQIAAAQGWKPADDSSDASAADAKAAPAAPPAAPESSPVPEKELARKPAGAPAASAPDPAPHSAPSTPASTPSAPTKADADASSLPAMLPEDKKAPHSADPNANRGDTGWVTPQAAPPAIRPAVVPSTPAPATVPAVIPPAPGARSPRQ